MNNIDELPIKIKALQMACEKGEVPCVMLQKELSIGYELASDLCEWLEKNGYVSSIDENYKRKTIITKEECKELINNYINNYINTDIALKNEQFTNDIIKFFISNGIKNDFTVGVSQIAENVKIYSSDITISPIVKGLPSFRFQYNLYSAYIDMYMHLTIPANIYNKNVDKWLSDFQNEFLTLAVDDEEEYCLILKGKIAATEMSVEKMKELYDCLIVRSPIMNEIITCSKEFNGQKSYNLEVSKNEKIANMILEYLIKNNIDYSLKLEMDSSDENNLDSQIAIYLYIDGLPNFTFCINAKGDYVFCFTILGIEEKLLADNFGDWEKEFERNNVFAALTKMDEKTISFESAIPQEYFSEETLKAIIEYLKTRSPLMDKIISLSEDVKWKK